MLNDVCGEFKEFLCSPSISDYNIILCHNKSATSKLVHDNMFHVMQRYCVNNRSPRLSTSQCTKN